MRKISVKEEMELIFKNLIGEVEEQMDTGEETKRELWKLESLWRNKEKEKAKEEEMIKNNEGSEKKKKNCYRSERN